MQAVRDAIDFGVGNGTLEIGSAGFAATLATIILADPASSVAGSVLTILGVPLADTVDVTGTAAEARIKDTAGTVVVSGLTVGTVGTDVIISSTSLTSGDTVTMTAGTITHG
jgi:hypothetical protein